MMVAQMQYDQADGEGCQSWQMVVLVETEFANPVTIRLDQHVLAVDEDLMTNISMDRVI